MWVIECDEVLFIGFGDFGGGVLSGMDRGCDGIRVRAEVRVENRLIIRLW